VPTRKQGRGAAFNPPNRFEPLHVEPLPEEEQGEVPTQYFYDSSRSILAANDSPDLPFKYSINPYRGCEHGCIYCYARATHEYLGFSAGTDFESKILIKTDAPQLLEKAFRRKSWQPQTVIFSGNTDCYQPIERRLELTRSCLQVFLKYRNPVSLITKSFLVTRDLDIFEQLAALDLVEVCMSITTLDPELARVMEPRASTPSRRLEALRVLSDKGIPTSVNAAPVIPGLTDEEIPAILRESALRGAVTASYILVRLPLAVESLFVDWLQRELPLRAPKILNRLREVRGGRLSDSRYGTRICGEGEMAESIRGLFELSCRKYRLNQRQIHLSTSHFLRNGPKQLDIF